MWKNKWFVLITGLFPCMMCNVGCCPLNCTHVWNYEWALSRAFPSLDRTMRDIDLNHQISPNSLIPSRTNVPLQVERCWQNWPNYTDIDPASRVICVDGEIGTVIKTYRELLMNSNTDRQKWFQDKYNQCKKIVNRFVLSLLTKIDSF